LADKTLSASQPAREPWWDRKLVLLIAGFILTGLIGPWLQFVQKQLEWQREIRLAEFNRKIAAMQSAREELTKAYVAANVIIEQEEHDRKHSDRSASQLKPAERYWDTRREERLRETASLFVMADTFPDPARIKLPLEELVAAWKVLAEMEQDGQITPAQSPESQRRAMFDGAKNQFDSSYDAVRREIEEETGAFENACRNRCT
jgi:type II secretory pathway pseudopilin PulG